MPDPSDPTRLLHVTTVASSLIFFRGQISYLQRAGYAVHTASAGGVEQSVIEEEGGVSHTIPMSREMTPFFDVLCLLRLVRLIKSIRPTIVHSHTPKGGLLGSVAAWLCRVPVRIFQVRGLPHLTARGMKRMALRASTWASCACSTLVICNSDSMRKELMKAGLASQAKAIVLGRGSGNGIDVSRFSREAIPAADINGIRAALGIGSQAVIFLFVGRITRDKGIADLLSAWPAVRKACPNAVLVLVGPTEVADAEMRAMLDSCAGDPSVRVVDAVAHPEPYYALADVFVFPSHREGLPNAVLEASAMELPVVVADVPGSVDAIVDGVTGALTPVSRPDRLADVLIRYCVNADLRQQQGRNGRVWVGAQFDRETLWSTLCVVYRERVLPLNRQ